MESQQKECPNCETAMQVMGSMPSLRANGTRRFLFCPACGKVETDFLEQPSVSGAGAAE
jgi:uncharacterized Zn finger protein